MKMVDVSANTLFLQKSLVTLGDISGNTMKMVDISANTLFLQTSLVTKGDISGNTMKMVDVSANTLFLRTSLSTPGDISGNTIKMVDMSSNTLFLRTSLSTPGDISGNTMKMVDMSANTLYLAKSLSMRGDVSCNNMMANDISGNSISIKKLSVNNIEITTNGSKADASYNTILGGNGANTSIKPVVYNSTAIGYGAIIDASNQIVVGTSGEFVCIPSNRGLSIGKTTAPASGYALDISGAVQATTYNATSDYRIKDHIRNLDDSDTISNLRPVKYMNKISNKNDFGLIAHELQIEYPDLVSGTKDGAEYQSVNYTGLISILIKEVQDLKKIVDNQATQLESQAIQLERINKQLYPND